MKKNKIGALTLTGLSVGPIMGSGVLILPPMINNIIGSWGIFAWLTVIVIGFLFAFIFGFLSIQFPGDGGVTNAIESVFGKYIKRLASVYLIIAVAFGAVAVLMTAADYMSKLGYFSQSTAGFILLFICFLLLLTRITFIGKVVFVMSLVTAAILLAGSLSTLVLHGAPMVIESQFEPQKFGYAVLLLFWTIIGWEVIGNYSADVADPKKTIIKAIVMSISIITIVYTVIVCAIQWSNTAGYWSGEISITTVVYPLFGRFSGYVMALLTMILCCSSYMFFVGGVIRLIASLAEEGALPKIISRRNKNNIPYLPLFFMASVHFTFMFLFKYNIFNIEKLVAVANGFFITNAVIGIITGVVLIKNKFIKISGILLALFFISVLAVYTNPFSTGAIILLAGIYI